MYVSDGFTHDAEVMHAPSVMKRFGMSCTWLCAFRTEVFGSRPMRAVPISWMPSPGGVISEKTPISFAPEAAKISAACTEMSRDIAFSLSCHLQLMVSVGM